MAEKGEKVMQPPRTIFQIRGPTSMKTLGDMQQVAQHLAGANVGPIQQVLVLKTERSEISTRDIAKIVDEGANVVGVERLAVHKKPAATMRWDKIIDDPRALTSAPGKPGTLAAARGLIIVIIVFGPIIIIVFVPGPIIVVADW